MEIEIPEDEDSEKAPKVKYHHHSIMWVKKNLIDPTASLSYCIGVSIIHLPISITLLFFIPIINLDDVKHLPQEC